MGYFEHYSMNSKNWNERIINGHQAWRDGDLDKAAHFFSQAVEIAPDMIESRLKLALVFLELHSLKNAKPEFLRCLNMVNGGYIAVFCLQKLALIDSLLGKSNEALERIDLALTECGNIETPSGLLEINILYFKKQLLSSNNDSVEYKKICEVILNKEKERYGNEHPFTMESYYTLSKFDEDSIDLEKPARNYRLKVASRTVLPVDEIIGDDE